MSSQHEQEQLYLLHLHVQKHLSWETLHSRSIVAEVSSLLVWTQGSWCLKGLQCLHLQTHAVLTKSAFFLDCLTLHMKALWSCKTSGIPQQSCGCWHFCGLKIVWYVHHTTHIRRSPKTDPEGEGTTEVRELLAQQHAITLQNTAVVTNMALGVFYWKSQYLNQNWYYGNQRCVVGGRNIQITWLIAFLHIYAIKFVAENTVMVIYSSFQKFLPKNTGAQIMTVHTVITVTLRRTHTRTHCTCWYNEISNCAVP